MIEIFLLNVLRSQNARRTGNFCSYFEQSRKELIFKGSNQSKGQLLSVDGVFEILFELYLH